MTNAPISLLASNIHGHRQYCKLQIHKRPSCMVICSDWVSQVINRGEDPYGLDWWSFLTLREKGSTKITIITGYNASITPGDTNFFTLQLMVLSKLHRQHNHHFTPKPRHQFHLDLQPWTEYLQSLFHEILLALDANDT